MDSGPSVLIVASFKGLEIANGLKIHIEEQYDSTIWNQNIHEVNEKPLEHLRNTLEDFDFAIFVLGKDEESDFRDSDPSHEKENILNFLNTIFNFISMEKTFIITPQPGKQMTIPAELDKLNIHYFDPKSLYGSIKTALEPASKEILHKINLLLVPGVETIPPPNQSSVQHKEDSKDEPESNYKNDVELYEDTTSGKPEGDKYLMRYLNKEKNDDGFLESLYLFFRGLLGLF